MDYQGLAILIASITTSIVTIVTLFRQGALAANVQKIEVATNSMKDALVKTTRERALLEGADDERKAEEARKVGLASAVVDALIVKPVLEPKKT